MTTRPSLCIQENITLFNFLNAENAFRKTKIKNSIACHSHIDQFRDHKCRYHEPDSSPPTTTYFENFELQRKIFTGENFSTLE